MTAGRTTTRRDRIEQRLALGDIPEEVAIRLHVPLAEVLKVGEAMDAAAREKDTTRDLDLVRQCPQGHFLTVDNLTHRKDGRRECLTCKRDRASKYGRDRRAARKAS